MNADLQKCFDRLDSTLNVLIDSLASYNPSPVAAAALVSADDELTRSLDRLHSHQQNYRTIKSLRLSTNALDERVKATLLQLVDMRRRLLDFDPNAESNAVCEVDQETLLDYAQRISRFTAPVAYRSSLPPAVIGNATVENQDVSFTGPQGESAHAPTQLALVSQELNIQSSTPTQSSHLLEAQGKALEALPSAVKSWLEPPSLNMPFMPWPDEERIRQGALGRIESTWHKGRDPSGQTLSETDEPGQLGNA